MVREVRNSIAFYGILNSSSKMWLRGLNLCVWVGRLLQPVGWGQRLSVFLPVRPGGCHPGERRSRVNVLAKVRLL